jgi:hypothetical protein
VADPVTDFAGIPSPFYKTAQTPLGKKLFCLLALPAAVDGPINESKQKGGQVI